MTFLLKNINHRQFFLFSEMIPDVIETVQSVFGDDDYDYGEYTLEEAYFNQLEEERLEKKREKKRKKKRKNKN